MNQSDFLKKALNENQHQVAESTITQILHYLDLLTRWNRVYNLTAIQDHNDMVMVHILDSLAINAFLQGHFILDVGSGAGLPGIPLALLNPNKKFTLIDCNNKKVRFLMQVVLELQLNQVEVVHSRLEDFHPPIKFDSILSRAFASLRIMLQASEHLISAEGQFLAMKGTYPEKELADLPPGFSVQGIHPLTIKGLHASRHLVCLKKENSWEKQSPSSIKKAV